MKDEESKKKFLQELNENEAYVKMLGNVKDENEKAQIKALAEDVYVKIALGFATMKKIIEENPEAVAEAARKRINNSKNKSEK